MIGWIIAGLVGLAVASLVILKWNTIVDWFYDRQPLKQSDKDRIAATIQEKLENGEYRTIQGIFNKKTNKCIAGQVYESKKIDEQLAKVHRRNKLVVYQ